MNLQESVVYLAQSNARSARRLREEEVNKNIPYFEIYKNEFNRYSTRAFAYEDHDNAPRMDIWCNYLRDFIFPNIDPNINISGFYNIELHDSYTYLKNDKDYTNVLTFSKFKNDTGPILIPDPYMIYNYGASLSYASHLDKEKDLSKKKGKACFYGTTTGNRDPILNKRINLCLWGLDNRDICDFAITNIAQMNEVDVVGAIPRFGEIYRKSRISIDEQLQYKYHVIPDGNTCRFDVWNYTTNNVVMKYDSKEMLWYYPLLQEDTHYVGVNKTNLRNKIQILENSPEIGQVISYNANKLAQGLFRPIIHQMYTINLFENMNI